MDVNQRFALNPSYYFALLLLLLHVGAVLILLALQLPWLMTVLLGILCGMSLANTMQRYAMLANPQAIIGFWQDKAGEWFLQEKRGKIHSAQLLGNSFCSRYLVLLNFKLAEKRRKRPVIILADSLSHSMFRQLQVQLLLVRSKLEIK